MTTRTRPLPSPDDQVNAAFRNVGAQSPWPTCRQCGQCCRGMIIECGLMDVAREPRIAERGVLLDGNGRLDPPDWTWALNTGPDFTCAFLGGDGRCEIYATRPEACAAFVPGEPRCTQAEGDH